MSVSAWKDSQYKKIDKTISSLNTELGQIHTAIGNLEALKNFDWKDFNTNQGGSGNKGSSAADKAAKQAAKDLSLIHI